MTEVQSIIAQLHPGQSRLSAVHIDGLMRQFFQRVKQTLRVVVCLRFSRKSVSFCVEFCFQAASQTWPVVKDGVTWSVQLSVCL